MSLVGQSSSDVLVNVSIPEYPISSAGNEPGFNRFDVTLSGDFVTLGGLRFKRKDFDEALKVLGYRPGPAYRGLAKAGQAQGAAVRVPGFHEHVGDQC